MPRPFLVLAGLSLSLSAANAASITTMPAMDDPLGPSMQAAGGDAVPMAVSGAIDRLETSSTGPAVIAAPTFVQTSPSIFEMIGGGTEDAGKARRGGQPMMIKAGVVGGSGGATPAPQAVTTGLPVEQAEEEEFEAAPDPSTIEVDDEAAPPTATPR